MITFQNDYFIVIDDFLNSEEFQHVWIYLQYEDYMHVGSGRWKKAHRTEDGDPLRGPVYISDKYEKDKESIIYPSNKAIDIIIKKIKENEEFYSKWVGVKGKDWKLFFARSYLYTINTGLSWHRDANYNATGAFVYYGHPDWNVQWGGEFLISSPSTRNVQYPRTKLYNGEEVFVGSHMDNSFENKVLLEEGIGTYILPKPNRFVLITSGILHCIKPLNPAAGNNIRASIQGFFLNPDDTIVAG